MKVLIAVDDQTHAAALVAKELFPHAEHIIMSAASTNEFVFSDPLGGGMITSGFSAEAVVEAESRADDAVQSAQSIVGRDAATQVEIGDAGSVICEQAALQNIDVIVVGRRSHSWFARLFDPSVSEYVIRHADCPVLVVKEANANS